MDPVAPDPAPFADAIRRLPPGPVRSAEGLPSGLLLARDGPVEVYYAPFEGVNRDALVALVGICPSLQQARRALEIARDWLHEDGDPGRMSAVVARRLPFDGMRARLARMLDAIELPAALGLPTGGSADALLRSQTGVVQATAAVRYPVLVGGRNYSGWRPPLTRHPLLRRFVLRRLGLELAAMPRALVVPLGSAVSAGLRLLVDDGRLEPARCLIGFPHPSGANAGRVAGFDELAPALARQARAWLSSSAAGSA